jgi:hypothetical protein
LRQASLLLQAQSIQRAADAAAAAIQDVRVDHGRPDVAMAEQFLDGADVVAVFEQVRGKRTARCGTSLAARWPRVARRRSRRTARLFRAGDDGGAGRTRGQCGSARSDDSAGPPYWLAEHFPVQEQKRTRGLILYLCDMHCHGARDHVRTGLPHLGSVTYRPGALSFA